MKTAGRPPATGNFKTREQLVKFVTKMSKKGAHPNAIAKEAGLSEFTIRKICKNGK
jgi:hypothetical protein